MWNVECVEWKITLFDHMLQVTLRSSEMGSCEEIYTAFSPFNLFNCNTTKFIKRFVVVLLYTCAPPLIKEKK